ncbi:hypothetical protein [Pseudomonas syringae]|nr:hypothetical protein [Pseudomonas syringae]
MRRPGASVDQLASEARSAWSCRQASLGDADPALGVKAEGT